MVLSTNRFDVDVGEVAQCRPLLLEELFVGQHDDGAQLGVAQVGRAQRHDEVAEAEHRRLVAVRETADDDVVAQSLQHVAVALVRLSMQPPTHFSRTT